jgi:hypothetical protein
MSGYNLRSRSRPTNYRTLAGYSQEKPKSSVRKVVKKPVKEIPSPFLININPETPSILPQVIECLKLSEAPLPQEALPQEAPMSPHLIIPPYNIPSNVAAQKIETSSPYNMYQLEESIPVFQDVVHSFPAVDPESWKPKDFFEVDCGGNGDCLYRVTCAWLGYNNESVKTDAWKLYLHLVEGKKTVIQKVQVLKHVLSIHAPQHLRSQILSNEYGCSNVMDVIANCFDVEIFVHQEMNQTSSVYKDVVSPHGWQYPVAPFLRTVNNQDTPHKMYVYNKGLSFHFTLLMC